MYSLVFALIYDYLIVLPRITAFYFEDNPVHSGQFVQVTCAVSEGDLPLTLAWQLNGKDLQDYPEITTSPVGKRSSILEIESVSYTHAGNYTCRATNKAGTTGYTTVLQVNGYL